MRTRRSAVLLLALLAGSPAGAAVVYVDADAPGPVHDGRTWATAFSTFQAGATAAYSRDEVWVAEGKYPTYFVGLRPGVGYYGGFAGSETSRDARDPARHPTILDAGGRATLLAFPSTAGRETVLDGFTLTGVRARNYDADALLLIAGGSPTIRNNRITNNNLDGNGRAAVTVRGGAPLFEGNVISGNRSEAILGEQKADITLAGNRIENNDGDGLYLDNSAATLTGNTLTGNLWGGVRAYTSGLVLRENEVRGNGEVGVRLYGSPAALVTGNRIIGNAGPGVDYSDSVVVIASNLIADNRVMGNAAGIICGAGPGLIANNTIVGHTGHDGGAIVLWSDFGATNATPTILNNILAGNLTGVYNAYYPGAPILRHNCVWDNGTDYVGWPDPTGTDGNIRANPLLALPDYGNFHIQPGSPCRDAGESVTVDTDLDGQPHMLGPRPDIGADESDGTPWPTAPRVWRVRPGGDDAADGSSWASARRTVQAALEAARAYGGGEVWVENGSYPERPIVPAFTRLYGGLTGTESRIGTHTVGPLPGSILDGGASGSTLTVDAGAVRSIVDGFTIQNGRALYGGGVRVLSGASVTIAHNAVTGNVAVSDEPDYYYSAGGGIRADDASVVLFDNVVSNNTAYSGAGVSITMAEAEITGNVIRENRTTVQGEQRCLSGGLYLNYGAYLVTGNTISGNSAIAGGGLVLGSCIYGPCEVARNTITDNVADVNGGGAILGMPGPDRFADNVVARNRAGERGGGLMEGLAGMDVVNNTFIENEAPLGGAILLQVGRMVVGNNVFAYNSSGIGTNPDYPIAHRIQTNLFFGNAGGDYTGPGDPLADNGNIVADPRFADRISGDYRLLSGSPAIDAGDDRLVLPDDLDHASKTRILGRHVDLGAFEVSGALGYRWWDVVRALRLAAGLDPATPADARLNTDGAPALTLSDAARLAHQAAGE